MWSTKSENLKSHPGSKIRNRSAKAKSEKRKNLRGFDRKVDSIIKKSRRKKFKIAIVTIKKPSPWSKKHSGILIKMPPWSRKWAFFENFVNSIKSRMFKNVIMILISNPTSIKSGKILTFLNIKSLFSPVINILTFHRTFKKSLKTVTFSKIL